LTDADEQENGDDHRYGRKARKVREIGSEQKEGLMLGRGQKPSETRSRQHNEDRGHRFTRIAGNKTATEGSSEGGYIQEVCIQKGNFQMSKPTETRLKVRDCTRSRSHSRSACLTRTVLKCRLSLGKGTIEGTVRGPGPDALPSRSASTDSNPSLRIQQRQPEQ